jgi:hypothetical protein
MNPSWEMKKRFGFRMAVQCDGLAMELDGIMYHKLNAILGTPPW